VDRARDQLSLFGGRNPALAERLAAVDVNRLTPVDALMLVNELKQMVEEEQ
jgi:hypothetical protein